MLCIPQIAYKNWCGSNSCCSPAKNFTFFGYLQTVSILFCRDFDRKSPWSSNEAIREYHLKMFKTITRQQHHRSRLNKLNFVAYGNEFIVIVLLSVGSVHKVTISFFFSSVKFIQLKRENSRSVSGKWVSCFWIPNNRKVVKCIPFIRYANKSLNQSISFTFIRLRKTARVSQWTKCIRTQNYMFIAVHAVNLSPLIVWREKKSAHKSNLLVKANGNNK